MRRHCKVRSILLLVAILGGLADLGHMHRMHNEMKVAGEILRLLEYIMLPGQQPPPLLCQPGTNLGMLLLAVMGVLAVPLDLLPQIASHLSNVLTQASARCSRQVQRLHHFLQDADEARHCILENAKVARDEAFKDPTHLEAKLQAHQAFEAHLQANKGKIDVVVETGEELIKAEYYAASTIKWVAHATGGDIISQNTGKDLTAMQSLHKKHQAVMSEISSHDSRIMVVCSTGEGMVSEGHFGAEEIQRKISQLKTKWQQLKEAESWMKEKEPIAGSGDYGKDEDGAQIIHHGLNLLLLACGDVEQNPGPVFNQLIQLVTRKQDLRAVVEMLLMMAGDVEPNPGPGTISIWFQFIMTPSQQATSIEVQEDYTVDRIVRAALVDAKLQEDYYAGMVTVRLGENSVQRDKVAKDLETTCRQPLMLHIESPESSHKAKRQKTEGCEKPDCEQLKPAINVQEIYVERECAPIKLVLDYMKSTHTNIVVHLIGPSGSGKSTTLQRLYKTATDMNLTTLYFDAATNLISDMHCRHQDAYIFVDNAQKISGNQKLYSLLTQRGKSLCLAFSPVISEERGLSITNCYFRATSTQYFTPFTSSELQEYIDGRKKSDCEIPDWVIAVVKKIGVYLPSILCYNFGDTEDAVTSTMEELMSAQIVTSLKKLQHGLSRSESANDCMPMQRAILCASLNYELSAQERNEAVYSGLFYKKCDQSVHMVYPTKLMLSAFQKHIYDTYSVMADIDVGMALEFLFFSTVWMNGILIVCLGEKPCALNKRRSQKEFFLQTGDLTVQNKAGDSLPESHGCHLIKLFQRHPAIDFLIIQSLAGKDSRKLFLIQVSAQKYQKRHKKMDAIFVKAAETGDEAPLDFYAKKLNVDLSNCYFVYAAPEVPPDHLFTTNSVHKNCVYLAKINVPIVK